jgi:hypothetical protein
MYIETSKRPSENLTLQVFTERLIRLLNTTRKSFRIISCCAAKRFLFVSILDGLVTSWERITMSLPTPCEEENEFAAFGLPEEYE